VLLVTWPAPEPVPPVLAEAGPCGVVEDVIERRLEVRIVPNYPAAEALLEQVAFADPAAVETLCIEAAQPVHPGR
jgi:hypothetical protein